MSRMKPQGLNLEPRQQLLLTFLAAGEEEIDPIRIMKGVFIFCQETPPEWVGGQRLYDFEPYNWGPVSFTIYRDLEKLLTLRLISTGEHRGATWKYYQITPRGKALAEKLKGSLNPLAVQYLETLRKFTLSLGFHDLLRAVYKRYPEYAVNSVFRF